MSLERRWQMIEPGRPGLSMARQCELLAVSRSGFYYQPVGETAENPTADAADRRVVPGRTWYGSRQMARQL